MSDYDMNIEALRPNKLYSDVSNSSNLKKYRAPAERTNSKQKQIITSFSKRNNTNKPSSKQHQKYYQSPKAEQVEVQSSNNKNSHCHSQYYIKTAESKNEMGVLQLQDEVRVKESQLEIMAKRLAKAQYQLKELTEENKFKTQRIQSLEREIGSLLAKSLKNLQVEQIGVDLIYECEKYKQDQMRLLRMLQNTAQYHYFSKFAELDNGIQFLRHPNQYKKSQLDAKSVQKHMHFCTCNKEFIPESTFWVPEKIYKFGREFIKQRNGEFTVSQFQLMLYQINRQWRERQKIIINTLNGEKARELDKLKRKYELYKSPSKVPPIK